MRKIDEEKNCLLIYQNDPCIVLGRFQNPWLEADVKLAKKLAIPIYRRRSGGGTVYHDLGNLNFSFIKHQNYYQQNEHFELLILLLKELHVEANVNQKNDIMLGKQKLSGSAFKNIRKYSLHHLTLLVHSDLALITKLLHHHQPQIETRAIKSNRSPMFKIDQHNIKIEKVIPKLLKIMKIDHPQLIQISDLKLIETVCDYQKEYASSVWRFEETPKFTLLTDRGRVEFEKLKIKKIESSHFRPQEIEVFRRFFSQNIWDQKNVDQFELKYKNDLSLQELINYLKTELPPL